MVPTQPFILLSVPKSQATDAEIQKHLTNKDDKRIWQSHGPAPNREFPKFQTMQDVATEIAAIKQSLRAKIDPQSRRLNLDVSGDAPRKSGLLIGPRPPAGQHPSADSVRGWLSEAEIDQVIVPELMQPYFEQMKTTLDPQGTQRGIGHDGGHSHANGQADHEYWLPGVLLIDEIFRALLSTTAKKITAANQAHSENMASATSAGQGTASKTASMGQTAAERNLQDFAIAISNGTATEDTKNFVPFINYKDPDHPTSLKLIKAKDGFIVGAIVHVGDWAGGLHSSGSAVP